jgi:ABC-type uncharacterized transport system substrate-binding protein
VALVDPDRTSSLAVRTSHSHISSQAHGTRTKGSDRTLHGARDIVQSACKRALGLVRQMRRREFIKLATSGAVTWPLTARAQHADRKRRIGVLTGVAADDPDSHARLMAFSQGLQKLGWMDGENVHIEYRWSGGSRSDLRKHAAQLVGLSPLIATSGTALGALLEVTRPVPIVFTIVADPVGSPYLAE